LGDDKALDWQNRMSILRSKLKGWNINIKAEMKKKKLSLVQKNSNFELLMEQRDLSDSEISMFFKAEMKKKKLSLVQKNSNFELLMEQRDLSDSELSAWFSSNKIFRSISTLEKTLQA
jgi:hypothetical protein